MAARLQSSLHTPCAGTPAHGVCGLRSKRVGLTLLELILALGLSVVLLFAVGMALRLYWRSFDVKRTNIEQSHLARAIQQRIAGDLRSAVQYTPVDLSGLESMTNASSLAGAFAGMTGAGSPAATAAGGSGTGAGAGTGAGGGSGTGGGSGAAGGSGSAGSTPMGSSPMGSSPMGSPTGQGQSGQGGSANSAGGAPAGGVPAGGATPGGSSTGATPSGTGASATGEATEAEETPADPPAVVGLYGSANQIQFDVSRLPRVDEYGGGSPASMVQIPSDIKTVTYYVRGETAGGSGFTSTFGGAPSPGSSEPSASGQGRGLMRLEVDRAVSAYGEMNGALSSNYDQAKLLADEVTSITFQYWDGTAWTSDWNSDEMGGLPLAVEIVMTMADPNAVADSSAPVQNFGAEESTDASYRMVVALPTASLPPPPAEETTEESATEGTGATAGGFQAPAMGGSGSSTAGSGGAAGSSKTGSSGSASYGTGSSVSGGSK